MDAPLFPESESGPSRSRSRSYDRPSLFDLLAQEQLRDLFHPVVRYVLSYFAQRHPRYLLRILNHHEEFFALLLLLVERHHLKKHNASLSEHFYGLRLLPSPPVPTPRLSAFSPSSPSRLRLNKRQRWGMLVFLVGVPYARARLQDYYERLGGVTDPDEGGGDDPPQLEATTRTQKLFRSIYPYANLALDVTFLSYDIAYLFDRNDSYRPWHRWLGLSIARRGPEDEDAQDASLLSHLPPLLPPLLLLLKLSQWWYSPASPRSISALSEQNNKAATHAAILPPRPLPILPDSGLLTPPPTPTDDHTELPPNTMEARSETGTYQIPLEKYGTCPLCKKRWQNPAILPSGWVVCWRCGWDAVEGDDVDEDDEDEERKETVYDDHDHDHDPSVVVGRRRKGRCPITGVPVGPGELRRVLV